MLESITGSISRAASAAEKLVAAQSTLSGRPTVTREVRVQAEPVDVQVDELVAMMVRRPVRRGGATYLGEQGGAGVIDVPTAVRGQSVAMRALDPAQPLEPTGSSDG